MQPVKPPAAKITKHCDSLICTSPNTYLILVGEQLRPSSPTEGEAGSGTAARFSLKYLK
jgi:hypothetical protein